MTFSRYLPATALLIGSALGPSLSGCSDGASSESSQAGTVSGTGGAAPSGGPASGGSTGGTASGGAASGGAASGGATAATGGTSAGTGGSTASGTVLLDADFENRSSGQYTEAMVTEDFGAEPPWNNGLDEGRGNVVEEAGNAFLRVDYPTGAVGPGDGGAQFNVALDGSHEELYASYRIRFASGFDFVKGGKIPGLCGGSCKTGGGGAPDDGFSARGMWRPDGDAVQYMYYLKQSGNYGEDFDWALDGQVQFQPGTWHTVVHRVVMGTAGQADGLVEAWLDGEKVLSRTGVQFRPEGASFGIDAFYFSTFFGGSGDDWAPTKDETIDFDDFLVSTGPIQ